MVVDMCHVHSKLGGYLARISTLDADYGLSVLSLMHDKSKNEEKYSMCFEFFKSNVKEITTWGIFVFMVKKIRV